MTIHIHIDDKEAEEALTIMAAHKNKTIEEQASELLIHSLREREIKLERLRARLALGEAQADRGEFSTKTADDIIREGKARYNARKL